MNFSGGLIWESIADATILPFDNIQIDGDSCCDTTGSKFTAPATGVYLFGVHVYAGNTDYTSFFAVRVDQAELPFMGGGEHYGSNNTATGSGVTGASNIVAFSVVLSLSSGEEVQVYSTATSAYYEGHSMWWGCRLS